jgi:saccharopine dehydrogenase-like NADP-dependent oxidoreductase
MKILALGGCGQQGSLAVRTLIEADDVEAVIVGDINLNAAKAFQEEVNSDKIEVLQIDVMNEEALASAMEGVDVVANFVGPFFRFAEPVVKAAISCGVDYVDICDDVAPTIHLLDNYHAAAAEAGVSVLLGMGGSPGLMNILVRRAADQLDAVFEANMHWALTVNDIETDLSVSAENAAIYEHAIELMAGNALQYLDGAYSDQRGGTGLETVRFANLGEQSVYYVSHPEPATIPRYIPLNKVVNKGCCIGMDEVLFALQDLGLAAHDTMMIKGVELQASDVAIAILARLDRISDPIPESELPACSEMFAEVIGRRGGEAVKIRMDVLSSQGLPRMDQLTGLSAAVGILMMGRDQISDKGVFAPEGCIPPAEFIPQLEALGIVIEERLI